MVTLSLLATALLFGGTMLYSFGFAAVLFKFLPADLAGTTLRRTFPYFYVFVIATAGGAAISTWRVDAVAAVLLALVAVTTVPTRQVLMPAINRATDSGARSRFKWLHGLSVGITLAHIVLAGVALSRFVQA